MSILMVLIPVSLVLMAIAGWFFIWAVDDGQYDDVEQHGLDILEEQSQNERDGAP